MQFPLRLAPALFAAALAGLVAACTSSRTVTMSALRPAEITFRPEVRTILILNRTRYHDGTVGLLEGLITGEGLDQDRAGLQAMIESLRSQLAYSGRFETRLAVEELPGNSLTSVFPPPLDWTQVDALLQHYGADLALGIEIYDSDFIITDGRRRVKQAVTEEGQKKEVEVTEFYAEGVANLTIGLRLYDPAARTIVDEDLFSRTNSWQAKGASVRDALTALIHKNEAASQLSRKVGIDYAYRIAPMPVRISRSFHAKARRVPEMELGARHADVGDWRQAAAVWERGLAGARAKEAGQLCYNIAIAHEVLGDYETARRWAERSYVEFGNGEARDYVSELDRRAAREEVARGQMQ